MLLLDCLFSYLFVFSDCDGLINPEDGLWTFKLLVGVMVKHFFLS